MAGRIGSYVHSDSITPNKGGALVRVTCQTDFAARTAEFIEFVDLVAKRAYGAGEPEPDLNYGETSDDYAWAHVTNVFPDLEEARAALGKRLKEKVEVRGIRLLFLPV